MSSISYLFFTIFLTAIEDALQAAQKGDLKGVQAYLRQSSASVDDQDEKFSHTMLTKFGRLQVLQYLVAKGAYLESSATMGQFHQRSTRRFYVRKLRAQLFCAYILLA